MELEDKFNELLNNFIEQVKEFEQKNNVRILIDTYEGYDYLTEELYCITHIEKQEVKEVSNEIKPYKNPYTWLINRESDGNITFKKGEIK